MRYVYLIRNLINGKVYVGQTKNLSTRKSGHLSVARRGSEKPLYRSIRKYGEQNFSFEMLEECADEFINEREKYWVVNFDSFNPESGYNLTSGGNQHFEHSEETKKRIGEYNTKFRSGSNNPNFGKSNPHLTQFNKNRKGKPGPSRFGSSNPNFGKRGTKAVKAKLNEEQVKQVQDLLPQMSNRKIAKIFNVSGSTISRIRTGVSSYVRCNFT